MFLCIDLLTICGSPPALLESWLSQGKGLREAVHHEIEGMGRLGPQTCSSGQDMHPLIALLIVCEASFA